MFKLILVLFVIGMTYAIVESNPKTTVEVKESVKETVKEGEKIVKKAIKDVKSMDNPLKFEKDSLVTK